MFQLIKQKENLHMAISLLDEGKTHQALDVINNHIKEVSETTKPNVENALRVLNEYLDKLKESAALLEDSAKSSIEAGKKQIEEAQQNIRSASEKLGAIEECCKIMMRSEEKLE
ncbi:TPA: hypothetical protein HA293_02255 [Candidatus Woesearchaeota archaeon]|nr:hypothetical protein [Candidatus Woesearchaeota archaeon]